MRTFAFPVMVISIFLAVCLLNYFLLVRWTPQFKRLSFRLSFWATTIVSFVLMATPWVVRGYPALLLPDWFRFLAYAAFAWLAGQAVMLFLLPILYLGKRLTAPSRVPATDGGAAGPALSRRAFLQNSLVALPAAALSVSSYGVYSAEAGLSVTRCTLPFSDLPREFDGFTVAQLCDSHLGPYFSLDMLDRVIDRIKAAKPDVVVITGDLIDDLALLKPALERLSDLAGSIHHGVHFCWGNHEYFRDFARIDRELKKTPLSVLRNSNRAITVNGRPLHLVGVDYPWTSSPAARRDLCRVFVDLATAGMPAGAFPLLLAHHPDFLDEGFRRGFPLTMAGHSHGGQVVLFGQPVLPLEYKYMRGLYEQNGRYGFVNSGAGHWFPFRLNCPPEVSVFTLASRP